MITTGSARQAAGFESRAYCRLILPRSHRQISAKSRHNGWSARRTPGAIATGVHGCGGRLLQFLIEILPVQSPDCVENHQRREAERGFVQHQQARAAHQRAADRQHLLLAAGQGAAALGHALLEPRKQREDTFEPGRSGGLAALGGGPARRRTTEPKKTPSSCCKRARTTAIKLRCATLVSLTCTVSA